jgi:hypothetical protein
VESRLILLYLSRLLLETSWWQSLMLTPVVKSRLLVAAQAPIHSAANTCRTITLQQAVQQLGDHPLHLGHRQRGCFFSRAWFPS